MADILPPYTEDERMLAGLVYPLWPLVCPFIYFGLHKDEPFIHFHALQALAVGVISIVGSLALTLIAYIFLWMLPTSFVTLSGFMGIGLFSLVTFIFFLWFMFVLYVAWRASAGEFLRLPFLGKWAEEKMQDNLGITEKDYATGIIGQKKEKKIDNFDYESALQNAAKNGDTFAQSELNMMFGQNLEVRELEGDYETLEYSKKDSGDISNYLQPEPQVSSNLPKTTPQANTGFKPRVPTRANTVNREPANVQQNVQPDQDGFRPLTSTLTGQNNPQRSRQTPVPQRTQAPVPQQTNIPKRPTVPPGFIPRKPQTQQQQPQESEFKPGIVSKPTPPPRQVNGRRTFQWKELND
ncbi:DUF4870 domain-containing protein [bacterium]|nr:DUF4870 domain-containing protein [bacterium]